MSRAASLRNAWVPALCLAASAVLAMALLALSHARWDALMRDSLIELDSLGQSYRATQEAVLFVERFLGGDTSTDSAAVLARLDRALVYVNGMIDGDGTLMGMRAGKTVLATSVLHDYRDTLLKVRATVLERMRDPAAVPSTRLREDFGELDRAAQRVDGEVLRQLAASRRALNTLDGTNIVLVALLAIAGLALLRIGARRGEQDALALAASEARLQAFATTIPGVAFLLDADGIYEGVFGSDEQLLVAPSTQLIGQRMDAHFPPQTVERFLSVIRAVIADGGQRQLEYSLRLPDGSQRHFEGRVCAVGDGRRVVWAVWDVTARWHAETRVRTLKRLYELLSNVNQAIVWTDDRRLLLDRICEIAVTVGNFRLAWVSWSENGGATLETLASGGEEGLPADERFALAHNWEEATRQVLASGEMVMQYAGEISRNDIGINDGAQGEAEIVLQRYAGIPLREHNLVKGVLNLLGSHVDEDDAEERALLREVGIDVSYALTLLVRQAQQRSIEARMRLHAAAMESTQDGVMVTDGAGRIVSVNNAFTRITGFTGSEVLGRTPAVLSEEGENAFYPASWEAATREGHWQGEIRARRSDGGLHAQWMTLSAVAGQDAESGHYVAVMTDLTQIKRTEERLNRLAHYDVLTGLPNRFFLTARLEHALDLARRQNAYVGVLFIDLDNFKNINDALGHSVGDEVLVAVAKRLSARLRKQDTLGRLGGDEFVLVLESLTMPQDAAVVAQDILRALGAPIALASCQEVYLLASVGIAIYPDDDDNAADLISDADAAMYQAKKAGRGTYRYYTEALTAAANYRLELESRLRRAFEHDEFSLDYQPLVRIDDGHLIGAEALVRLRPPGMEPISPGVFIPLLEETGLIVTLGEWVLRAACRQGKAWLDSGFALETLAVNVSPIEIRRGGLEERLQRVLAETGFPPERLELELTESGLMEQGSNAERFAQALKALGVRLSIDDFGTGYSSLSYLRHLPVDKLKIDRSFISEIVHNQADQKLVATIVAMARSLNLTVLAEGVEADAQLELLRETGCDAFQGYLCSPPLPPEAFERRFLQPA